MFRALFKIKKQPMSINHKMEKIKCIITYTEYSAIKVNEVSTKTGTTRLHLENIMLSKKSQTQKATLYYSICM